MAEQVDLGDGNRVPQWVTEETGQKLIDKMEDLAGANKKLTDAFEKFIKETIKANKNQEENEEDQIDALEEIKKAIGDQKINLNKKGGKGGGGKDDDEEQKRFLAFLEASSSALKDFALATFGLATQAMGLLAKSAYNVGDTLADLAQTGVGITASEVSQTTQTLQSLNQLGLNASEASGYLQNFSGAVQIAGQARIVAFNQALAQSTNFGLSLGMTFNDLISIVGEDLELRQKLGVLNQMESALAASRSQQLFQMQLRATSLLGRSIQDIRDGAKAGLEEDEYFATVVNQMGRNLEGTGVADLFVQQVQMFGSELAGRGVSSELIGSLNEMFAKPIAFMGEKGQELLATFTTFGDTAGIDLVSGLENIQNLTQALANETDEGRARDINARLLAEREKFVKDLASASTNLTDDMGVLPLMFDKLGSSAADLALAIPLLAQSAGKEVENLFLNSLLVSTKTFAQSLNMIKGGVSAALTKTSEGLAPLMQNLSMALVDGTERTDEGFIMLRGTFGNFTARYKEENIEMFKAMGMTAEEMEEAGIILGRPIRNLGHLTESQAEKVAKTNSILEAFQEFLVTASTSVATALFGLDAESQEFGVTLRDAVTKRLEKFSDWFENGGGQKVVDSLKFFGNLIMGIASPFIFVFDMLMAFGEKLTGATGSLAESGKLLGQIIGGLMLASLASKTIFGKGIGGLLMGGITNKVAGKGFFGGGGGGGGAAGGKLPDGKAAAKTGAGFGAGAKGMAAFGAAAAGVGIALVGLSMAFETFRDMEWGEFGKSISMLALALAPFAVAVAAAGFAGKAASPGLLAIGVALAGIGIAAAGIGAAAAGISMLIPSETEKADAYATKINASAEAAERLAGIPVEQIEATAAAIETLGNALENMGNKVGKDGSWWNPFDNDTGVDLDKQNEQIDVFARFALIDGTNMLNVATGISNITDAYGKFAELDGAAIAENAKAVQEFNQATGNTMGSRVLDFGMNLINNMAGVNSPTPDTTAMTPIPAANNTSGQSASPDSPLGLLRMIEENTRKGAKAGKQTTEAIVNA